jgi:hypothetical protein
MSKLFAASLVTPEHPSQLYFDGLIKLFLDLYLAIKFLNTSAKLLRVYFRVKFLRVSLKRINQKIVRAVSKLEEFQLSPAHERRRRPKRARFFFFCFLFDSAIFFPPPRR